MLDALKAAGLEYVCDWGADWRAAPGAASRKGVDYIKGHDRVWFARGGEILDAYRAAIRT
jgi:hypothetical protein